MISHFNNIRRNRQAERAERSIARLKAQARSSELLIVATAGRSIARLTAQARSSELLIVAGFSLLPLSAWGLIPRLDLDLDSLSAALRQLFEP